MSSYIRLEILLFFRAFETGVGMLVVYRLTDMLKRRLFCDRMWNSTVDILYWLLAGLLLFSAFSESLGQLIADNRSETVTGRTVCPDTDNDDIVKRTVGF